MVTEVRQEDPRWVRTRERLLHGGRKVFASTGVEAATVLEIVEAAGVSQPSFYNHFASKDELARAIAAEFFRVDLRQKKAVFEQVTDPAEAIAINIGQTLAIATQDPVIAWTLIKSGTLRDLVISSSADPLVEMLNSGAAQGRFVASSTNTIALTIRGAALALVQAILNGTAEADAVECFPVLMLCLLGLSPEESEAVAARARSHLDEGIGAAA